MKCYCFTNKLSYGGGCALVAANSHAEAYGVLVSAFEYNAKRTDLDHCNEVETLIPASYIVEPSVIIEHFYEE